MPHHFRVYGADAVTETMTMIEPLLESGLYLECCCSTTLPLRHEILLLTKEVGVLSIVQIFKF